MPSRKVTEPVGIVVFPDGGATLAVKLMLVPEITVVAEALRVVVVTAGGATITATTPDVEAVKLLSPL